MHLADDLRDELERRLALIDSEQAHDPAFHDLPGNDVMALLVLVVLAILGTLLLQVS